jgi:hypothetical protein
VRGLEFYDKVDDMYLNMIKRPMHLWRIKLELLDHDENTVMCIEKDIDYSNAGSISCNNTQGSRKTCSITLINVDLKYIPTEDSPFWFNRKFRVYIGIVDNRHYKQGNSDVHWTNETDTYWFSKGVYITSEIHVDSTTHTVSISGIDKFGQLDGSLNVLQADEMNTVFEYGAKIKDVIQDILTLDLGNGQPLDPITPLIDDISLNSIYLYKEFTLSAGQYYGDFLNELATSYGAEVYYDNIGRLVFRRLFSDDFPYWIGFKAPSQEFKYHLPGYQSSQESLKLTGVNKIIVSTDNVETPNGSYTAINTNPRSPLCYNKIGARTFPENGGVIIINAGNIVTNEEIKQDPTLKGEAEEKIIKRCRDYAEYRLMQETCLATSITFNCPPYLHLNEGDVVIITDPDFSLDCDLYIINSITFPLGADAIQLEVSNLGFLNTDISYDTKHSLLENQPVKFGIAYILNGGTSDRALNQSVKPGETFVVPNDYDEETHLLSIIKDGCELINWTDNINGDTYALDGEYTVPNQNFSLYANWINYEDYILELRMNETSSVTAMLSPITNQSSDVYSAMFIIVDNKKYYFWGRDFEPTQIVSPIVEGTPTIKYGCVPIVDNTVMTLNGVLTTLLNNGISDGKVTYLKYPNAVESLDIDTFSDSYLETIVLPKYVKNVTLSSQTPTGLKEFEFNNDYNLSFDMSNTSAFLVGYTIQKVSAKNNVAITTGNSDSYILYPSASSIKIPNIDFAKGIKIDNSASQGQCLFMVYHPNINNTYITLINIGNAESEYRFKGGLELYNVVSFAGNYWKNYIEVALANVYFENSKAFFSSVRQLQVSGDVKLCNGSIFLSYSQLYNTTFSLDGDYIYVYESTFMQATNLTNVNIKAEVKLRYNGNFIISNTSLKSIDFRNNVEIDCSEMIADETMNFVTGNSCTAIRFYGAVTIDCGNVLNGLQFICNNNYLTDVYFYDDNFTVTNTSYGKLFENNNANFKIHGVANGNVQAFAESQNIPFEVIT